MPLIGPSRLGILTFPQGWEPNSLLVRFLCLPKISPLDPLAAGQPSFATANLVFEANIISGLAHLPRAADAYGLGVLPLKDPPVNKDAFFAELDQQFNIKPRIPKPALAQRFLKPVTESYRSLVGRRQLSDYLTDEKDFECAIHDAHASQPSEPEVLTDEVTWGQLMAYVLRQPKLAMALGLIGEASIDINDPVVFEKGGWLYVSLHAESDYAGVPPPFKALYAARIPPLGEPRSLYAPVLFPVDGTGVADDVFREAELYDQGFARMVHGAQVQDRGDAIRLAWDDEQIAVWLNRQVHPATEAPMGTAGYRVDVRRQGGDWNSLVRIKSNGDLKLGAQVLGPYEGESVVEVMPAQIAPGRTEFWMPPYFTTWRGSSLVLTDKKLTALHNDQEGNVDDASLLLNREKTFVPVSDTLVPLLYGQSYDFRVRLADLTFGGPSAKDDTPPVPHAITTIKFQPRTRPGPINVIHRPTRNQRFVRIAKPRLGYPEALFTGVKSFADLRAELDKDIAANREREMSAPDPDVLKVEILVEVRSLEGDVSAYLPLYTTTRVFDRDEIDLNLEPRNLPTLDLLALIQPDNGPLVIPTARDIRLTLIGLGRDDADYFAPPDLKRGVPDFRRGVPITVEVRASAQAETALFNAVESPLRSFFFRLPPADGSVASPPERLAVELDLDHSGLTLSGRKGSRCVFACSSALRHTLSPERASITLSSSADLIQRWINILQLELARDWTWDDLADEGIAVQRRVKRPGKADVVELAGTIRLPRAIARTAITGVSQDPRDPARQSTKILFFDAYDPKPTPKPPPQTGEFPTEITFEYEIAPTFKDEVPPPAPFTENILVPIATPPAQVPKLVSAGIALSPYAAANDYSFTEQRRRSLWLEFDSPPIDPDDAYFVRVLAIAPDPMLIAIDESIPEVIEPPQPIDEEWMRLIAQDQPRDDSGLHAMNPLDQQAPGATHYLVPLPKGLDETSLELFGMFTYEIRVGHTDARWSLAQARYGPPLRVAGMQHPTPPLVCQAARNERTIRVRAPYATAIHNGRNVRPRFPRTSLWAVLYARVRQTDAASWRNVLLARARMPPPQELILSEADARTLFGEGFFDIKEVNDLLLRLGLPDKTPLTTLAVELFTDPIPSDPLGQNLGHARMLRVSPLAPVPDQC
jgi:hypothetical protein